MTPLVPFLNRLAEAATSGGSAVRAALPSRFAAADAAALRESEAEIGAAAAQRIAMAPDPATSRSQDESPLETEPPPVPPAAHPPEAPVAPARDLRPEFDRKLDVARVDRNGGRPSAEPPLFHESITTPVASQPAEDRRPVAVAAPLVAPPPRPPLREGVVMQRALEARDQPAVVQVTLDRIDVRMPRATTSEPRSEQRRRPPATVSLGDYLRQRANSGSGAGT